jgi:carbamoyl-phosphate synthase large subunit
MGALIFPIPPIGPIGPIGPIHSVATYSMNVLLTCVGRRCYSVDVFKQAVGNHGRVFATDCNGAAPALQNADEAFIVPSIDHEEYVDTLLYLCNEYQIRLLIPALEPELSLLAIHRERFLAVGTILLVPSPQIVSRCYDKLATSKFLQACGLEVPRTFDSLDAARSALAQGEIAFPLVVKPRWGVSSIGILFPTDDEDLEFAYRFSKKQVRSSFLAGVSATDAAHDVLIQEQLYGNEYGMDVVNDLNGRYVCTFIRRKISMRAGNTDRAVTERNDRLEKIGCLIGENLGHIGLADCDLFVTETGCYVIDINPRIGGGYPFVHAAGANYPAALVAWASGQQPDPAWFQVEPNVAASRYETLIVTNGKRDVARLVSSAGYRNFAVGRQASSAATNGAAAFPK